MVVRGVGHRRAIERETWALESTCIKYETLTAQGPLLLPSEQSPPAPSWRRTLLLGTDDDNAALATAVRVRCAADFFFLPKTKSATQYLAQKSELLIFYLTR